jgi:hypothetical protein
MRQETAFPTGSDGERCNGLDFRARASPNDEV